MELTLVPSGCFWVVLKTGWGDGENKGKEYDMSIIHGGMRLTHISVSYELKQN